IAVAYCAYRRTNAPNSMPPLLCASDAPAPPAVRSPARLLPRGAAVPDRRPDLRLHGRFVPRSLPRVPPRPGAAVLRLPAARAADAAEEVQGARAHRRAAQTKPLGLRDRGGPQGAPDRAQPDGGPRGAARGGLRPAAAPPRR